MGFWDFLKKNNTEKEEIKVEKIAVEELRPWLLTKKKKIAEKEENFLKLVREKIAQLIQELEEEASVLKRINVEEKKAEEKIKLIVRENLHNYIYYLERLINKLKEINKENGGIIEKIDFVFFDFKKRSSISFEKTTFLIGKEMASVKDSTRNFFENLDNILKENKKLIDESKIINSAEKKIEKLSEIEKIQLDIKKLICEYDVKINSLRSEIKIKEEEIKNIKKSEKFIKENRKMGEIEKKKAELEKEIYKLKEMIDLKSLANFFHSFQKEMDVIKAYKENFKNAFQKESGADILGLIREAKLQNIGIIDKIEEINKKKKEIETIIVNKTGIEDLEIRIKKIESEIETTTSKKFVEEKRRENLERNLKEAINLIREDLIKINLEVLWLDS